MEHAFWRIKLLIGLRAYAFSPDLAIWFFEGCCPMAKQEDVEQLRQFVMEHGLPLTDMALFGVRCPYCGKSDRIRALESPEELENDLPAENLDAYRQLWQSLSLVKSGLGVCKFCQNVLGLPDGTRAEPLFE